MSAVALPVALVCALAFAFGDAGAFEYQRNHSADWWRYLSASFVHYGSQHLLTNLAALLVLGTLAERLVSRAWLAAVVLTAAVGSPVIVHLILPEYETFRGISVVNYLLLGVIAAGYRGRWSAAAAAVALLHQAIIAVDAAGSGEIRPVWQLHLMAMAAGALMAGAGRQAPGARSAGRPADASG